MIFVDSSAWFAAVNRRDRHHPRAIELLAANAPLVTSDLVIVETWLLTNSRIDFAAAERFLRGVIDGSCEIVPIGKDGWRQASAIADRFLDQTFSIVDRTSFAAMERLGITQVVSFYAPYMCPRCGLDEERLIDVARDLSDDKGNRVRRPPSFPCTSCGAPLVFDDIPERYFAFL